MSVQAMGWVLDHSPSEGSERLVLLSLANHAGPSPVNGAWESYPGVETIQREANLRRARTVQEVLARLVEGGHIERVLNGAPDERIRGDRRPNLYRILVARGAGFETTDEASRGAAGRHPVKPSRGAVRRRPVKAERGAAERRPVEPNGVPSDDITGCRLASSRGAVSRRDGVPSDGTQTVIEPSVEPSVEPNTVIAVPATARPLAAVAAVSDPPPPEPSTPLVQSTWDLFWQRWPRKTHKQAARAAWRRLIGAGVRDVEILAGLDPWITHWQTDATDEQFIPHPANWLRRRDWAEAPPTPATRSGSARSGRSARTEANRRSRAAVVELYAQAVGAEEVNP